MVCLPVILLSKNEIWWQNLVHLVQLKTQNSHRCFASRPTSDFSLQKCFLCTSCSLHRVLGGRVLKGPRLIQLIMFTALLRMFSSETGILLYRSLWWWRTLWWLASWVPWVPSHTKTPAGLPFIAFVKVKVTQSCLTLCDPMDYTVHGILQARILEWLFPLSRGSSQPRDRTQISCIPGGFFTSWATREARGFCTISAHINMLLNHKHCFHIVMKIILTLQTS